MFWEAAEKMMKRKEQVFILRIIVPVELFLNN